MGAIVGRENDFDRFAVKVGRRGGADKELPRGRRIARKSAFEGLKNVFILDLAWDNGADRSEIPEKVCVLEASAKGEWLVAARGIT